MSKSLQLSVLSYNIHKGFRTGGKQFVLHDIRKLIRATGADLVFLQEVIGENSRHSKKISDWPEEAQYEFLADPIWPDHSYGKNAVYRGGHHGNALLSRYPIVKTENVDISTNRRERRGMLLSTITLESGAHIHACCTHLDLTKKGRATQIRHLCKLLYERVPEGEPLILAGDFNDWQKSASAPLEARLGLKEAIQQTHGKLKPTFPSSMPILSLDRVYARGLNVVDAKVLKGKAWRKLSDHVPVQAIFDIPK